LADKGKKHFSALYGALTNRMLPTRFVSQEIKIHCYNFPATIERFRKLALKIKIIIKRGR